MALREAFPLAEQFAVSAREGTGLDAWFERIAAAEPGVMTAPDVDYELYAEGEALLGWLNCTLRIQAAQPFDGNQSLLDLARRIQHRLADVEIAHLKMTMLPDEGNDIGVLNLVRNDGAPESSHSLKEPLQSAQLIINLRAEGEPELLKSATLESVRACGMSSGGFQATVEHVEHFRPAKPQPTYRMATI